MAIQAHDDALEGTALGKEFVHLLLAGVKGEIANVEGAAPAHLSDEIQL